MRLSRYVSDLGHSEMFYHKAHKVHKDKKGILMQIFEFFVFFVVKIKPCVSSSHGI